MNVKTSACAALLLLSGHMAKSQTWQALTPGQLFNAEVGVVNISATPSGQAWGVMSTPGLPAAVPYCLLADRVSNSWLLSPMPLPNEHTPVHIFGLNPDTAWVATYALSTEDSGRIYQTTDGGATWTRQMTADFRDAARFVHFFSAGEGVAIGDSSVFTTANGGATWNRRARLPLRNGVINHFLYNAIEVRNNTLWTGDDAGNIYKSTDRGASWSRTGTIGGSYSITGIAFRDSLNGLATVERLVTGGQQGGGFFTDDGHFYRTADGGATWTQATFSFRNISPTSQGLTGEAKFDIAWLPGSAGSYVITSASASGFSAITEDNGASWSLLDSGKMHLSLAFIDQSNGWSGGVLSPVQTGMYRWQYAPSGIASLLTPPGRYIISYPNPATEQLFVTMNSSAAPAVPYRISDMSGRVVQSGETACRNGGKASFNISRLCSGSYLLQLSAAGELYYSRFSKQ